MERTRREKIEKEAEKERVRKRMEEDKAERFKSKAVTQTPTPHPTPVAVPSTSAPNAIQNCTLQAHFKEECSSYSMQIRLPDGQTQKLEFKSDTPLRVVHHYISSHFTNNDSSFSLITNFPKKEFKDELLQLTLQQAGWQPPNSVNIC
jgi:hypothetical protein